MASLPGRYLKACLERPVGYWLGPLVRDVKTVIMEAWHIGKMGQLATWDRAARPFAWAVVQKPQASQPIQRKQVADITQSVLAGVQDFQVAEFANSIGILNAVKSQIESSHSWDRD